MKCTEEAFIDIVTTFQNGYFVDREVQKNEKLALVVVLSAITKLNYRQVLKIKKSDFVFNDKYVLKIHSPKAKHLKNIILPESSKVYIEGYCRQYYISENDYIFLFNPEYVCRRLHEMIVYRGYSFKTQELSKVIPYNHGTLDYQKKVSEYMGLLYSIPPAELFKCDSSHLLCKKISEFISINLI